MSEFTNSLVSFQAVIFTVTSIFFLGFWIVTTLIGSGFDSLGELDLDVDVEMGGSTDVDAESGSGRTSVATPGSVQVASPAPAAEASPQLIPDTSGVEVVIPEVGGMRIADALTRLFQADLKVTHIDGLDLEDFVVSTEPPEGARVPIHSIVTIVVGTTLYDGDS